MKVRVPRSREIKIPLWFEAETPTAYIFGTDYRDGCRILKDSCKIIQPAFPVPPCGVVVEMGSILAAYTDLIEGAT